MLKRFFFLSLILLTPITMLMGQNGDRSSTPKSSMNIDNETFQKTTQSTRVFVIGDSTSSTAKKVSLTKTYETQDFYIKADSLTTNDSVKTIYLNHNYMDCFVTLYDTVGVADTFYIQRYDSLAPYLYNKYWTNAQGGFVDIATGSFTSSVTGAYGIASVGVIIPGAGLTKTYYLNEPRPGTYRVWVSQYAVANAKKRYIKWTGKNR